MMQGSMVYSPVHGSVIYSPCTVPDSQRASRKGEESQLFGWRRWREGGKWSMQAPVSAVMGAN
jgi:hypothetical protein